LQNKYQAYLPKVDPELIHDLLTRQQENPQVPHFLEMKNAYYDMLKKKLSSENDHVSQKAKFFLMCRSCFWCASILYEDLSQSFRTCPTCMNHELEFMPISIGESYKFDYDKRHGVVLEFIQRDRTR
jgi:hypothetical protein